jgi:fructose-1,6-bisphosphatase/inositol monophosphatase family enzyme
MVDPLPERGARLAGLLRAAGDAALAYVGTVFEVRRKADQSPVTDADLAAEAVLIDGLRRYWPDDGIVSEERGEIPGGAATWVVDPIDGTSAFTEGIAHWGPTVARLVPDGAGTRVDTGALYLPRLDEHYHVEGGRGWMNGAPMAPMASLTPNQVLYLPSGFHKHFQVEFPGKARCLGGTAAHLCLVARGAAVAVIVPPRWSIWDTAAGLSLIDALGGRAARLSDGAPLDPFRDTGLPFVAGFPDAVEALLQDGRLTTRLPGAVHAGP